MTSNDEENISIRKHFLQRVPTIPCQTTNIITCTFSVLFCITRMTGSSSPFISSRPYVGILDSVTQERTTVCYSQFPCCLAILLDIYKKVNLFPLRPSHLITSSMQFIVSRNSSITGICVCVTGLIVNRKEKRSLLLLLLLLPVVDTT